MNNPTPDPTTGHANDAETEALLELMAQTFPHQAAPLPTLLSAARRGQRRRTRDRRLLATAIAGTAAAGVAVAASVPFWLGESVNGVDQSANDMHAGSDLALIEACREGSQPEYWTDLIFGSGKPRVAARSDDSATYSSTVLVSGDGNYWADCIDAENSWANTPGALNDAPARPNMTVYRSVESESRPTYTAGENCADGTTRRACETFFVSYTDRLPAAVAQVEFTTVDGDTTRVETTNDGFVVYDHRGTIPNELRGREGQVSWLTKIAYLDSTGTPLAANRLGEAKYFNKSIDGLPQLSRYPSLTQAVQGISPSPSAE